MADPKINPRLDHLFWASLLLSDHDRCELAISALAIEQAATRKNLKIDPNEQLHNTVKHLITKLLRLIETKETRNIVVQRINQALPEGLKQTMEPL